MNQKDFNLTIAQLENRISKLENSLQELSQENLLLKQEQLKNKNILLQEIQQLKNKFFNLETKNKQLQTNQNIFINQLKKNMEENNEINNNYQKYLESLFFLKTLQDENQKNPMILLKDTLIHFQNLKVELEQMIYGKEKGYEENINSEYYCNNAKYFYKQIKKIYEELSNNYEKE